MALYTIVSILLMGIGISFINPDPINTWYLLLGIGFYNLGIMILQKALDK